jgi:uncharacterized protein (DUF1778 family)
MPRVPSTDSERMNLRLKPDQKSRLVRAAALKHIDLTSFILELALKEADTVIAQAEHLELSERDSLRVLSLLENPPEPNARLRAAAKALPKQT